MGQRKSPCLKLLQRQLKSDLQELRDKYKSSFVSKNNISEWLLDNFNLLEREGRFVLNRFKSGIRVFGKRFPNIYLICLDAVYSDDMKQTLAQILEEKSDSLTTEELEQIDVMLTCAYIHLAAQATKEKSCDKIAKAIGGIHNLKNIEFSEYITKYCKLEKILSTDPSGDYPNMDDDTRWLYRSLCAKLSEKTRKSETKIAEKFIERSKKSDGRRNHVGYWLLENEKEIKKSRLKGAFLISLKLIIPFLLALLISWALDVWWLIPIIYLPLIEAWRPLIEIIFERGITVRRIPRMELGGSIPESEATLVVVSSLVPTSDKAASVCEHLKQLARTNCQGAVKICLLADLKQADKPFLPEDKASVQALKREMRALNREFGNKFILTVRHRSFISTQKAYAGYERKRGAIHELVKYIKTGKVEFMTIEDDEGFLKKVKHLILLDSDTSLPMDAALSLVSAAAHPLCQPYLDEKSGVITEGYGILAPKISTGLESSGKTAFTRIMSGAGGVTAYDTLSGDLYQDLFRRSNFAGKGLLSVDAFYKCMDAFFPDELILSHDILEGSVLRCAFVSDVEFTDSCPLGVLSYLSRLHRWIRGDWQNIRWLSKKIPSTKGKTRNPFDSICRYMIFDNLRRSLTPIMAVVCLFLCIPLASAQNYLAGISLQSQAAPGAFAALIIMLTGGFQMLTRKYHSRVMTAAGTAIAQMLISSILLVQTAWISLDAIIRAIYRQIFSKKNLLQWVTAADSESVGQGLFKVIVKCWPSVLGGVLLFIFAEGWVVYIAAGFAVSAPFVAYFTRKNTPKRKLKLSAGQREKLLSYAAAMWGFYEQLCGEEDNYLPPDNIQESPVFATAHRTSPTNIGLMLLCTLAARDFGFIDTETLAKRIKYSLDSIEKLEKWKGNLINWYDTTTLETLHPKMVSTVDSGNFVCCMTALYEGLRDYQTESSEIKDLICRIEKIVEETDLTPLYNKQRSLFHIGYDMETGELTPSYYDLLMSESRMSSYFAIAKRQVPVNNWGALGRLLIRQDGYIGLASWTGTMFEYFMPQLLLPTRPNSLCSEALMFCIYAQRKRAAKLGVPWGVSESAYFAFDNMLNYQYKAHGIGRLGLKRGLDLEYVLSPYSTFLALPLAPSAAMKNLERIKKMGMTGRFGFYEAADFTRSRIGSSRFVIIKNYMAHHVGMSFLSIINVLYDNIMQKRFMAADGMLAAAELLEEKIPSGAVVSGHRIERDIPEKPGRKITETEVFDIINPNKPRMQLLSNAEWSVAITDIGTGISSCQGVDMIRRSDDLLRRPLGIFAVVETPDKHFSITRAPDYCEDNNYEAEFTKNSAEFFSKCNGIEAGMKVQVHEILPCEIRSFALKNTTSKPKNIGLLIYMEPSLARNEDDSAHPAFSRLFVRGEYRTDTNALVFSRRPREGEASTVFMAMGFSENVEFDYDFDRENVLVRPDGVTSLLRKGIELKQGAGVPDTCAAIRVKVNLPPKNQKEYTLLLTVGRSRDEAVSRLIDCRRTSKNIAISPLFDDSIESRLAATILPKLLFPCGDQEERVKCAIENKMGVHGLWSMAISGDYPIVLIEINNAADLERAENFIKLHKRLRRWGVVFDLIIAYRKTGDEEQKILFEGAKMVSDHGEGVLMNVSGGIRFINLEGRGDEVNSLFAAARYIAPKTPTSINRLLPDYLPVKIQPASPAESDTSGYKVVGGVFHDDKFTVKSKPILPWSHVIANESFGTLVSDSALGYTWALNSRENKLTPWYNDSRTDNRGEMLIINIGGKYYDLIYGSEATFRANAAEYKGMVEDISYTVTVSIKNMSKLVAVELNSKTQKSIRLAYYTEPVLGINRSGSRQIRACFEQGALILNNGFNTAVPGYSILTIDGGCDNYCCDRADFLCGQWNDNTLCPQTDSCAAVVAKRQLDANNNQKISFILGYGQTKEEALSQVDFEQNLTKEVNKVEVFTPDEGLNMLMNHWLPVQIEHSRIYGRTGFYQCGGAYGYRDQLQDVCAQMIWNPEKAKEYIIKCAERQFEEGDVLHWWHPMPTGDIGVRTRCSDDMHWLPYTVCKYIRRTNDYSILDEQAKFLSAPVLSSEERQRFFAPSMTEETFSIYEHCLRAISTVKTGKHGLPLIGTCDWNDGLSKVGEEGQGESVWLAQFASMVFEDMAPIARHRGDNETAEKLITDAKNLKDAVQQSSWCGEWYARAYMDNGTVLGSPKSDEMKIDILPQAFSVFSNMDDKERRKQALQSVEKFLVDESIGIIKLFTPAFDKFDPGYIRGYFPGVRENGGQYTHGAIWFIDALLAEGESDRAYELLNMISPVTRNKNRRDANLYKLEPYAIAADVYSSPDAPGRGGWSLYTGSAAWYYRTVLSGLLGIAIEGNKIIVNPKLPEKIPEFKVRLQLGGCDLNISVKTSDSYSIIYDGVSASEILLKDGVHSAEVTVPRGEGGIVLQ